MAEKDPKVSADTTQAPPQKSVDDQIKDMLKDGLTPEEIKTLSDLSVKRAEEMKKINEEVSRNLDNLLTDMLTKNGIPVNKNTIDFLTKRLPGLKDNAESGLVQKINNSDQDIFVVVEGNKIVETSQTTAEDSPTPKAIKLDPPKPAAPVTATTAPTPETPLAHPTDADTPPTAATAPAATPNLVHGQFNLGI